MKFSDICTALNKPCATDMTLSGISIDSRQVKPGHLFIAIAGERFDGHQFMQEAIANGAVAVLCSQEMPAISIPQLVVPDTLKALAIIATAHRKKCDCNVIALTGSNGKTTVKEMIAAILPKPAHATPGNLNNHIGVPLSVLNLKADHRYAVFELGANHIGEIAYTVAIVQPQVTLINNIAPAHIAEFGSIEDVARAKGEIYQGLMAHGTAVINDDDAYAHFWDPFLTNKKVVRFSVDKPTADMHARSVCFNTEGCGQFILVTPEGEASIQLQVPGAHNVSNALAAAACTYALDISLPEIAAALCQFRGVAGRMSYLHGKNNALVIDDTYNANLRSSLAAIDVLSKRKGKRIFVFGDMGELGRWSVEHHAEVGIAAREQGIDILMTCGTLSESTARAYGATGKHYEKQADLVTDLLHHLDEDTTVLVKGSRSSAMEKIVDKLVS